MLAVARGTGNVNGKRNAQRQRSSYLLVFHAFPVVVAVALAVAVSVAVSVAVLGTPFILPPA